jgi:hypothetical protein
VNEYCPQGSNEKVILFSLEEDYVRLSPRMLEVTFKQKIFEQLIPKIILPGSKDGAAYQQRQW